MPHHHMTRYCNRNNLGPILLLLSVEYQVSVCIQFDVFRTNLDFSIENIRMWDPLYFVKNIFPAKIHKDQVIRDLWLIVLRFWNRNVLYLKRTDCEISKSSTPSRSSKQRSSSNECNGNNSLSPEWILHSFGLENTELHFLRHILIVKLTSHKHCSNDVLEW